MHQLLTPQALAALLGISTQTIYNRLSLGGDLPPKFKVGRLVRFKLEDVSTWIDEHQSVKDVTQGVKQ